MKQEVTGSSPLARGLLTQRDVTSMIARIIPARAGSTNAGWVVAEGSGDHPRSRGVYTRLGTSLPCQRGSSPLARGLPDDVGSDGR